MSTQKLIFKLDIDHQIFNASNALPETEVNEKFKEHIAKRIFAEIDKTQKSIHYISFLEQFENFRKVIPSDLQSKFDEKGQEWYEKHTTDIMNSVYRKHIMVVSSVDEMNKIKLDTKVCHVRLNFNETFNIDINDSLPINIQTLTINLKSTSNFTNGDKQLNLKKYTQLQALTFNANFNQNINDSLPKNIEQIGFSYDNSFSNGGSEFDVSPYEHLQIIIVPSVKITGRPNSLLFVIFNINTVLDIVQIIKTKKGELYITEIVTSNNNLPSSLGGYLNIKNDAMYHHNKKMYSELFNMEHLISYN